MYHHQTRSITPQTTYRLPQQQGGGSSGTSTQAITSASGGVPNGIIGTQQKLQLARPASASSVQRRNPTPTVSHNKLQPASGITSKIIVEEKIQKRTEGGVTQTTVRKYYKERFLGKGGFAQCYLFRQVGTNSIHAAKIIDKKTLEKDNVRQKLFSEIKIHNSLSHRHIVNFVRYFEDSENVYILLELCNCGSMMDLLKSKTRLTEQEARFFLHQLLMACLYMNEKRVIHRDLKLGNLFLTDKMEIKIGDFGLATQLEFDGERKKTICGTPNYIAPEILLNKGHSFEVDVWSIGVILYTMLVGTPPFETKDVKETYKKIRHNDYEFPEDLNISVKAKSLVKRILRRNPEDRPDVKDILNDAFFVGTSVDYCPSTLIDYSRSHSLKISDLEENILPAYSSKNTELQQQLQKLRQQERVPFRQIDNTLHQRTTSETTVPTSKPPISAHNTNTNTFASTFRQPLQAINNENLNPIQQQSNNHVSKPPLPKPSHSESPSHQPLERIASSGAILQHNTEFAVPEHRQPVQITSQTTRLPTPKRRSPSEDEKKSKPQTPTASTETALDPPVKKSRTPSNAPVSSPSSYSPTSLGLDPMNVDAVEDDLASPITELPTVWITHWADFSNKYGLAYLLSSSLGERLLGVGKRVVCDVICTG